MKNDKKHEYEEVKKSDLYQYQKGIKKSEKGPSENNNRQKKLKREMIISVLSIITGMGIMIWLKEILIGFMLVICGAGLAVLNIKQQLSSQKIDEPDDEAIDQGQSNEESLENTPPIDDFDPSIKHRVLLQKTTKKLEIKYVRVKSVNKLVVNGKVYDEYKAVVEFEHCLSAIVGGCKIEAGLDSESFSYINVNGKKIAWKQRLI